MIEFACKNCGEKFSVPENDAGKKGYCPRCKEPLVAPEADSVYDLTLLDFQQQNQNREQAIVEQETEEQAPIEEIGSIQERKLPWPVDALLYPTSKAGLSIIAIVMGIPFMIFMFLSTILKAPRLSPLLLVFVVPLAIIGFIVTVVLVLYLNWYVCECIRDSAEGGIRAPETLGCTPGAGEIFWLQVRVIFCLLFFLLPVILYFQKTRETNMIFWCLAGYAAVFFPMGLLAIVMFDSLRGLSPTVLVGSIINTFLPYCALVAVFLSAGLLIVRSMPDTYGSCILIFIVSCIRLYIVMVGAHLLGWFYHRYEQELNWDV
jgi:hypothetical protein